MKTNRNFETILSAATAALALMASGAPSARADDQIFQASAGATVAQGTQEAPSASLVYGTVTLSSKGEIKILWDGLSVDPGHYTVGQTGPVGGAESGRTFVSAALPTTVVDLQKVLGVRWMDSIRLSAGAGSYDDNPVEGKTDVTLGQIAVNLTQSVVKTRAVQWTVTEGVNTSYFRRQLYESQQPFQAVPVNFTVNSKLVARIAPQVSAAISMGAYASVVNGIQGNEGFRSVVEDLNISPTLTFGDRFTMGGSIELAHMNVVAGGEGQGSAVNASGFVRYVLSGASGGTGVTHAIELNVASIDDGIVKNVWGEDTRSTMVGVKYIAVF